MTERVLSTDPKQVARREADKKKREAINAHKETVRTFTGTPAFGKLPKDVQASILFLSRKPQPGGGGGGNVANSLSNRFRTMFPKVGDTMDLLSIFKAEQWGLAETRNKIREALVKAPIAERLWIDYDESKEVWCLVAIGGSAPKDYKLTVPKAVREADAKRTKK